MTEELKRFILGHPVGVTPAMIAKRFIMSQSKALKVLKEMQAAGLVEETGKHIFARR
jgi:DNA-binding IclR family transcriptional regulator